MPIADGAQACPFVAFEDDRDERATVPDHRHRCYADVRPSPRAFAHQEAYCLSSAFPVCPTFQDWARRESARARADAQAREDEQVADGAAPSAAGAGAAAGGGGADLPADDLPDAAAPAGLGATDPDASTSKGDVDLGTDGDDDRTDDRRGSDDEGPRRNPPRDWSAPPPWLASSEAARGGDRNAPPPDFLARRADEPGQGLAGSAADRLAGGPVPKEPSARSFGRGESRQRFDEEEPDVEELNPRAALPPRRPRAYDQHLGGPSSGPDWERPRRYEAYPTIKTRVGMPEIPRLAVVAGLIGVAALAFFFLPAILGLGGDGSPGAGSPSLSAALPSASVEATSTPAPTSETYIIKKGETLSKIATDHGVTLEQLLAANPTIKNPNKITEGQEIIIPTSEPTAPEEFGPSESPAASP